MQFICERCGHTSTTKGNLIQHLQRKTECPSKHSECTRPELISRLIRVSTKEKTHECDYCHSKFSTPQGKSQHKKVCPKHPSKEMQNRIQTLEDNIRQLQEQVCVESLSEYNSVHELLMENEKLKAQIRQLQAKKNEDFYQQILEKHFKATHKKLPIGITDITTEDAHIEIKRWSCWREAFAQLILYNSHDPKEKLYACFFGEYTQPAKNLAIASLKQQNITCFEFTHTLDAIYMTNVEDNTQKVVWTMDAH